LNVEKKVTFSILLLLVFFKLFAQSIPVLPMSFDEDIRTLQLQGKISPNYSLSIRPLYFTKKFTPDSFFALIASDKKTPLKEASYSFWGKFGKLSLLPTTFLTKYNSRHPYGWNDGAFIPARGIQSMVSTGFFAELGPLAIQFKPEFIYASNSKYEVSDSFGSVPSANFKKKYWGQSSVRLNGGPVSLGLSSENLWWGPGQFSSLMMSNNAPGFLHLSFNSRKPLKTPVGFFEWQFISGKLEDEKNIDAPIEIANLWSYRDLFGDNSIYQGDWKYINAMTFTFQPSFLKGIYVGFSRQFSGLSQNVFDSTKNRGFVNEYLPVLGKLFKSKLVNDDSKGWNQLANIFFRALLPKSNAEFYVDYGWNDHSYNERDFIMTPVHSSSFLAGFKKGIKMSDDKWLFLNGEVTHMEQTPDYLVRWAGSWYEHYQGTGYSNANQIMGAGAGFGSNMQVFSANYQEGYWKIGVLLERVQREPNTHKARWSDISLGFTGQKKIKDLLLAWRISGVDSKNYGWKQDASRFNILGMLSLNYYW
jgi:hypothetical protein